MRWSIVLKNVKRKVLILLLVVRRIMKVCYRLNCCFCPVYNVQMLKDSFVSIKISPFLSLRRVEFYNWFVYWQTRKMSFPPQVNEIYNFIDSRHICYFLHCWDIYFENFFFYNFCPSLHYSYEVFRSLSSLPPTGRFRQKIIVQQFSQLNTVRVLALRWR